MTHVTCHVSRVTCHVSRVTCHVSHVTCHVSHVFFLIYFFYHPPPKKIIGPMIRIGREIQCLPYAEFLSSFFVHNKNFSPHASREKIITMRRMWAQQIQTCTLVFNSCSFKWVVGGSNLLLLQLLILQFRRNNKPISFSFD